MATTADKDRPALIPSTRFMLALLVSFALFVQYSQRVGLSMAIVCMVDKSESKNKSNLISALPSDEQNTITRIKQYGPSWIDDRRFHWKEFEQQILLGAYWFGYIFTLVPGGSISIKFGIKKTFGISIFLSSISNLIITLIYLLDDTSLYVALSMRILMGFVHGPLFPATYTAWSMWAVPLERSTLAAIGFCSTNLGTSVTMLFGGSLCQNMKSGWIYIFIFTALFGFIWLPLWLYYVADSPATHHRIDETERKYICDHLGIDKDQKKKSQTISSLPWNEIVKTPKIIALFITEFCNLFGLFFFYTNVGKILVQLHQVPTEYAGYVLAGGFILMPICSLSSGLIADNLVKKKISLTIIRKIFNSIASFIPALCMVVLCFCDKSNQVLGVITVIVFLTSSAAAYGSGYIVNFVDIMPACSSIVFGISTAIATAGALGGNVIAGLLIKKPVIDDWRRLFILFSIIYTIGGLAFVFLGSARPCEWAKLKPKEKDVVKEAMNEEEILELQTAS